MPRNNNLYNRDRSSRNRVPWPSPIVALDVAQNRANDSAGTVISNSDQGLDRSISCNQGHLASIALSSHRRFGIPSPPAHLGRHTMSYATAQFPPRVSALPHQRKPLQIFIIVVSVCGGRFIASMACTGSAHNTERMRINLPLFGRVTAFQLGKQPEN